MQIIETDWKWKTSFGNRGSTKYIVLHHAAASTCSVADIHRWHQEKGWAGIGYHFFVRKDGSVYRGRPIGAVGAHCLGWNSNSIGICAEGNFQTDTMPDVQRNAILELIEYLKRIYPGVVVNGHRELDVTACPGINYPLTYIKKGKREEKPMPEQWKLEIMEKALDIGLITEEHNPDDLAQKWFVLATIMNGMKGVK